MFSIVKPLLVCLLVSFVYSEEWFSSLGHMEELLKNEVDLVSSLEKYLQAEYSRLDKIRNTMSQFEQIANHAKVDTDTYLSHPINQFRLIKRMGYEWRDVEQLLNGDNSVDFVEIFKLKQTNFPSEGDLKGSAQALLRLQDTYKLDTKSLADGVIKESKANQSLTAEDCYYIGREAYLEKDYYHCKIWMSQVLAMQEAEYTYFTKFDVMDHLSYCVSRTGNLQRALKLTITMMEMDPSNQRIQGNYRYYQKLLGSNRRGEDGNFSPADQEYITEAPVHRRPELAIYERLCRVQPKLPVRVDSKLKCYYWNNNNNPRLVIAPVKLEEMYPSPHIVRFHDIVSDSEIEVIQRLAKPRLYRATVQNPFTGVLESADYRVSKSAWLKDYDDDVVKRVCQRIEDVTGLSMSTAEDLQIANYGMGGQYEPHYDYARESDAGQFDEEIGNRIATFLFYFTDISYGGSTVFLTPEISAKPIKGSAVFWYNLYPSGKGDLRTRHAACPVLTGIKWVGNKWIHERGQEFNRKCGLNQNDDNRIF